MRRRPVEAHKAHAKFLLESAPYDSAGDVLASTVPPGRSSLSQPDC